MGRSLTQGLRHWALLLSALRAWTIATIYPTGLWLARKRATAEGGCEHISSGSLLEQMGILA